MICECERYRTNIGSSCLTACVMNYIHFKGFLISEEYLMLSAKALITVFKKNNGLKVSIFSNVIQNCNDHNVMAYEIMDDFEEIDRLIASNCMIFAYVDKKYISYSKIFSSFKTSQILHCINITGTSESGYEISDGYIPTRIPGSFEGLLSVDKENFIKEAKVYRIDIINEPSWTKNEIICTVRAAVENYILHIVSNNPFKEMACNILLVKSENVHLLLEYSISIAVGGVLASRKLFFKLIYEFIKIEKLERIKESEKLLLSSYKKLQLLLSKCYLSLNEMNIQQTIQMINNINEIEMNFFGELINYMDNL